MHSEYSRKDTVVKLIQSGDDDYLMNETRRTPTTGTRCPTLIDTRRSKFELSLYFSLIGIKFWVLIGCPSTAKSKIITSPKYYFYFGKC